PGRAIRPVASTVRAPSGASRSGPIAAILPSTNNRSTGSPPSGRAPRIRCGPVDSGMEMSAFSCFVKFGAAGSSGTRSGAGPLGAAEQQVEHGHAQADAVGDLLGDGAPGGVGDLGR